MVSYALSSSPCAQAALLLAFSWQGLAWVWVLFLGQDQLRKRQGGLESGSPCAALAPPLPGSHRSAALRGPAEDDRLPAAVLQPFGSC